MSHIRLGTRASVDDNQVKPAIVPDNLQDGAQLGGGGLCQGWRCRLPGAPPGRRTALRIEVDSSVRTPPAWAATAKCTASVVLPLPPFRLRRPITCMTV